MAERGPAFSSSPNPQETLTNFKVPEARQQPGSRIPPGPLPSRRGRKARGTRSAGPFAPTLPALPRGRRSDRALQWTHSREWHCAPTPSWRLAASSVPPDRRPCPAHFRLPQATSPSRQLDADFVIATPRVARAMPHALSDRWLREPLDSEAADALYCSLEQARRGRSGDQDDRDLFSLSPSPLHHSFRPFYPPPSPQVFLLNPAGLRAIYQPRGRGHDGGLRQRLLDAGVPVASLDLALLVSTCAAFVETEDDAEAEAARFSDSRLPSGPTSSGGGFGSAGFMSAGSGRGRGRRQRGGGVGLDVVDDDDDGEARGVEYAPDPNVVQDAQERLSAFCEELFPLASPTREGAFSPSTRPSLSLYLSIFPSMPHPHPPPDHRSATFTPPKPPSTLSWAAPAGPSCPRRTGPPGRPSPGPSGLRGCTATSRRRRQSPLYSIWRAGTRRGGMPIRNGLSRCCRRHFRATPGWTGRVFPSDSCSVCLSVCLDPPHSLFPPPGIRSAIGWPRRVAARPDARFRARARHPAARRTCVLGLQQASPQGRRRGSGGRGSAVLATAEGGGGGDGGLEGGQRYRGRRRGRRGRRPASPGASVWWRCRSGRRWWHRAGDAAAVGAGADSRPGGPRGGGRGKGGTGGRGRAGR